MIRCFYTVAEHLLLILLARRGSPAVETKRKIIMTLLSYHVFKTVVEQGSFQKAAEMLSLTPSAVSHAVSSMEQELGFSLFVRSKSGITMTNYGQHLFPYINAVLNSDESLKQAISQINGLQKGTVKVGCFSSICTNWMADIIHTFEKRYPAITIEVYQGTYSDVAEWIKNGTVDFGFLSASSADGLPIEPLQRDRLLVVVPADFRKTGNPEKMTIAEMREQNFVSQMEGTDADIINYLKKNNLDVRSIYHVEDDLSTVAMVAEGFGICIMPEMVMHDIPYDVKTYLTDPPADRIIGVCAKDSGFMAPAVKMLYRHIIKTYKNV